MSKNIINSTGVGPAVAMNMLYVTMSNAVGMQMHNAVTTQLNGQIIANAALSQNCTLIIASALEPGAGSASKKNDRQ